MAEGKTRLVFTPLHGDFYVDGEGPFTEPETVIENADPDFVRKVSHAHAAGAVEVHEGLDLSTVQSQEDGEAMLREAMGEHRIERLPDGSLRSYWTGPWQHGQDLQAALEAEARDRGELGIEADVDVVESGADEVSAISLTEDEED